MNIYIPFTKDKNLGREVNKLVSQATDKYIIIQDGDVLQLNNFYGNIIAEAIEANPDYALYTCYTNRIGCQTQLSPYSNWLSDDIAYHRDIADKHWRKGGTGVIDITDGDLISGHMLAINVEKFKDAMPLPDMGIGCDNEIHKRLRDAGHKIGLMLGIYVYHWYRGGNKANKEHWK